jgi:hypothetical protein
MNYEYPPQYPPSLQPQPQSNNNETIIIGGVVFVIIILILAFVYSNYIDKPVNAAPIVPSGIWKLDPVSSDPFANCKGEWGTCSEPCGDGIQKYKITAPKKGEGRSCVEDDGATKRCNIKDCADDCVGEWLACSATCGEGSRTYKVKTPKKGDGKPCPHGHGSFQSCKAGDYILNCENNHSNFKKFFESQYGSLFDMIPIKSKRTDNTQCELEYSLKFEGFPTLATDKRIFSLQKNNNNCSWDVVHMGDSLLPKKKEESSEPSGPCKAEDYTYTGGCGSLIAKCWDGGQGCRGNCYRWCNV